MSNKAFKTFFRSIPVSREISRLGSPPKNVIKSSFHFDDVIFKGEPFGFHSYLQRRQRSFCLRMTYDIIAPWTFVPFRHAAMLPIRWLKWDFSQQIFTHKFVVHPEGLNICQKD
jgi:hypothetical protein